MKKALFYVLSFTWGLPMTLIGLVVSLVLLIAGYKPKKHGWCYYFEVGVGWGGLELGVIFLTSETTSKRTRNHEHGHALQNCIWGPLFPFVVSIPSAIRYWLRECKTRENKKKFAVDIFCVLCGISVLLLAIGFTAEVVWLMITAPIFFLYFVVIYIWLMRKEIPLYDKGFVPYDSVWFERQASKWGNLFINRLENKNNYK